MTPAPAAPVALPMRLHDLLTLNAAPDARPAAFDGDTMWDYGRLRLEAWRLAAALRRRGVRRGDRVALYLPKSLPECAALFAASLADAVIVPINPLLRPAQVRHILADCEARALVCTDRGLQGLGAALHDLEALEVLTLEALDQEPAASPPPPCQALSQDLAAILYTSGSTGLPKGVMLSHANLLAGTRIVRTYLGITAHDRLLSVLPFSFDYGLNQWLTCVEQGASIALLTFTLGDEVVRALQRHQITGLAGVPTLWALLTKAAPSLSRCRLPHLRYLTNSGGAVPQATVQRLRELLPDTQVVLMYGLTEAFRSTYLPPDQIDLRPGSIGRAIPECEVFALTAEGRRARPGEVGVLVHRGPTVSMGYWRRPGTTAQVIRRNPLVPAHEGADWVCWSGDLVTMDVDGYLYFVGRQDALIKSAGYRISPTEVEEALMQSGQLRQAAVVGLPDEWLGQRLHAVLVPMVETLDTATVLREAAALLPAHMVPKTAEVVAALPVTPNGKVDYRALVERRSASQEPV